MPGYVERFAALVEVHLAECASEAFGQSPEVCRAGVRAALPAIVEGLAGFGTSSGEQALFAAVLANDLDAWLSEDLLAALADRADLPDGAATRSFPEVLSARNLFGESEGAVAGAVAAESGLPEAAASRLLDAVSLALTAYFRAHLLPSAMEATALSQALERERAAARALMTARVAAALGVATPGRPSAALPPGVRYARGPDRSGEDNAVGSNDGQTDRVAMRLAAAFESSRQISPLQEVKDNQLPLITRRRLWLLSPLLAAAALAATGLWVYLDLRDTPLPRAPHPSPPETVAARVPAATAQPVAAPPPLQPPVLNLVAAEEALHTATDMAELIAPRAGVVVKVKPATHFLVDLSGLVDDAVRADDLAIARYDVLQQIRELATRGDAASQRLVSALQIVTPLFAEEIHVIVRADEHMTYIQQIRDKRINSGPYDSSSGVTARLLYRRMFGTPIPPASESFFDPETALHRLIDRSVDVVIAVGGQPIDLITHLDPDLRGRIKLLALDPRDRATQHALDDYFDVSVWPASYPGWLPAKVSTFAVPSFLVTGTSGGERAQQPLRSFAAALCTNLTNLRASGHPKWREMQPGLELDAGVPYFAPAELEFQQCGDRSATQVDGSSHASRS